MVGVVLRHSNFCKKSVTEMGIALICSSVHKVSLTCTRASFYAYSIHKKIVNVVDNGDFFLWQLVFTDEAMFRMNCHVNRNNCYTCQLPCEMYGHVQDSLEVSVQCGIVHGAEHTVMSNIYLYMLHLFLFP
jgi:hypothetical protein